jgi:DNA-binding transcriptional MerR regulator
VLRLDFVRTLRELGLDLATIRRVLDQEADLPRVAAAHAEALSAQIRLLRMRRSVLRTLARIFDGIPVDPDFATRLRSVTSAVPADPTDEQVDAWIELAVDPRPDRYWQLMGIINGWPPFAPATPAFGWFASALRAALS